MTNEIFFSKFFVKVCVIFRHTNRKFLRYAGLLFARKIQRHTATHGALLNIRELRISVTGLAIMERNIQAHKS